MREGRRIKAALQMARLASLSFADRHEAVHLIGQSGTGESHLAVALGVEAIRAGRSVCFSLLADLIGSLARADRQGRLARAHPLPVPHPAAHRRRDRLPPCDDLAG